MAPAAADTTTVSPGCGLPTSSNPKYAAAPVEPNTLSMGSISVSRSSLVVYTSSRQMPCSCQLPSEITTSPGSYASQREATISPTELLRTTSPISTAGR